MHKINGSRYLKVALILFGSILVFCNNSFAQAAPPGLDQVLSSVALVVKDRANEVALDTVRRQLLLSIDAKYISIGEINKLSKIYLGRLPDGISSLDGDVFFGQSYYLLQTADLSLADPILLKSINRELIEFVLRVSLKSLSNKEYSTLKMKDVSVFVYEAIEMMANPRPDVHRLGSYLIGLADIIDADFYNTFSNEISNYKVGNESKPIEFNSSNIHLLFKMMVQRFALPTSGPEYNAEKLNSFVREADKQFHFSTSHVPVVYRISNLNSIRELSSVFRIVGTFLIAHQVDSDATSVWLNKFSDKVAQEVGPDKTIKKTLLGISNSLEDEEWQSKNKYINSMLKSAFSNLVDTLVMRLHTTKSRAVG